MSVLTIDTAEVFEPLLEPRRYKGARGGRGSGKSYFFAGLGIEDALRFPGDYGEGLRWLCAREVQKSLKESAKHLIETRLNALPGGAEANGFKLFRDVIETPGDGLILFQGLQDHTADSIKSLEGVHRAWLEEAHSIRARSWGLLRPTIREELSEIWCSWNPDSEDDPVDAFFVQGMARGRADMICVEANWNHNPWFPEVLRAEKDDDYANDPEMADHVWGGAYSNITEGAYYAKELLACKNESRIGHFPHDVDREVDTAWDIGVDDYTAIWFFQNDGRKVRVIDYYETSGDGADLIVQEAIRSKPYRFGTHYLPHDVNNREWGAGAKKRIDTLRELGLSNIRAGARLGPEERINATRALLPVCEFHEEKTWQGIKRLRNYRRRMNRATGTYAGPLHDEASHGADAFGEFAVNCPIVPRPAQSPSRVRQDYVPVQRSAGADSWL